MIQLIGPPMTQPPATHIEPIRDASRQVVRALGFLRPGLAGTDLPASAVHALLEIDARGRLTAGVLATVLQLDRSSVSRMLRRLVARGDVHEEPGEADGRLKWLSLTPQGQDRCAAIHAFGRAQVASALARLTEAEALQVRTGLGLYATALTDAPLPPAVIETGYLPGALARCIELHARHYAAFVGFGRPFEAVLAAGLADFAGRMDRPCNRFWRVMRQDRVLGTIAIDGEDLGPGIAHLRWFILDAELRGAGLGRALVQQALAFADAAGYGETHLWTFRGLDAARHLYEQAGFVLADEKPGSQWGREVIEQQFIRRR